MRIYFAPLEGITDDIYRSTHSAFFGGVDKYYTPFISPTEKEEFSVKERRLLGSPNVGNVPVVPQILTKDGESACRAAKAFYGLGFKEININLGCPSGTVTAKGKGSGLLKDLEGLRQFLDAVYTCSSLPVSLKTRIGYSNKDEWPFIYDVLKDYPIYELTIHPRTREEFYGGEPHTELIAPAMSVLKCPIVYNGNLFSTDAIDALHALYPTVDTLMAGRGLIASPALAREYKTGEKLNKQELFKFLTALWYGYKDASWPDKAVIAHMHEIMFYVASCFDGAEKQVKAIKKASDKNKFTDALNKLFDECALKESPKFIPPPGIRRI